MTQTHIARPDKIGALLRSADLRQVVAAAIAAQPGLTGSLHLGSLASVGARMLEALEADLLLLDVDLDDEADMTVLARLIEGVAQHVPIVVTAKDPTVAGTRRLMRLGILDLVPQPVVANDLVVAIASARRRGGGAATAATRGSRGRIISFIKACGGSGATTMVVHAASHLARQSGAAGQVCLLDLDLQFGAVALYLDLTPKIGLMDVVHTPERLDSFLLRGLMTTDGKGLDVLASPEPVLPLDLITPELAARLVEVAASEYRHVLIDLPHAWSAWTRNVLAMADAIVLVTPMSVPGIRQCRRQIGTLAEEGLEGVPLFIVANRYERGLFGKGARQREAERALGRDIHFFVPNDERAVSVAIDAGATLIDTHDGAKVLKAVAALVDALPAGEGITRRDES